MNDSERKLLAAFYSISSKDEKTSLKEIQLLLDLNPELSSKYKDFISLYSLNKGDESYGNGRYFNPISSFLMVLTTISFMLPVILNYGWKFDNQLENQLVMHVSETCVEENKTVSSGNENYCEVTYSNKEGKGFLRILKNAKVSLSLDNNQFQVNLMDGSVQLEENFEASNILNVQVGSWAVEFVGTNVYLQSENGKLSGLTVIDGKILLRESINSENTSSIREFMVPNSQNLNHIDFDHSLVNPEPIYRKTPESISRVFTNFEKEKEKLIPEDWTRLMSKNRLAPKKNLVPKENHTIVRIQTKDGTKYYGVLVKSGSEFTILDLDDNSVKSFPAKEIETIEYPKED